MLLRNRLQIYRIQRGRERRTRMGRGCRRLGTLSRESKSCNDDDVHSCCSGIPQMCRNEEKEKSHFGCGPKPEKGGGGGGVAVKLNRPLPVFSLCFPCLIRPPAAAKSHYHHQKQLPTETDSDVSLITQNNNRPTPKKNTSAKETNLHLTCRQFFESNGSN